MKLLLYSWNANNEQILADNLIKTGYEIVWFRKECKHYTRDMELAMEMIQHIHAEGVEAVVSLNYFPIISMICNTCCIPYYSWVYDCPHFTLYAKQIFMPCNHIGIFDREMVSHLEAYGVHTVSHVPLSVDTEYFNKVIRTASEREREKYQCDISFVGSLYTGEHNYYDLLSGSERKEKKYVRKSEQVPASGIERAIRQQCFAYRKDYLKQAVLSDEVDLQDIRMKMEKQGLMLGEDYFAGAEDILIPAVLEKKVTVEERQMLMTKIVSEYSASCGGDYDFRLYTGSDTAKMPALFACSHGTVDYHTQMPLVFAGSKINLNITLRSIHSGIPLRVLDIMACGGFVLTNLQPEIAEYFEDSVEIAIYNSLEECMEKIGYYLQHEKEREQIAAAGYRKVQEAFAYQKRIGR